MFQHTETIVFIIKQQSKKLWNNLKEYTDLDYTCILLENDSRFTINYKKKPGWTMLSY